MPILCYVTWLCPGLEEAESETFYKRDEKE